MTAGWAGQPTSVDTALRFPASAAGAHGGAKSMTASRTPDWGWWRHVPTLTLHKTQGVRGYAGIDLKPGERNCADLN